ncbi:nitrous oxide reductase family maturation protein NosD, partial [Chloroflexota bacterium]
MTKTKWYQEPIHLMVALALVLSLGMVAVPMPGTVEASPGTDYYVAINGSDGDTGLDWAHALKTITYAVESKATTTGDVIHVADGVYDDDINCENFPIDFNTNGVSLIGAGGDTSIIDANNQEVNILNIWADGVSISWFELRNARAKWWVETGHGIYMNDADDCDISNLEIYNLTQGTSQTREPVAIFMENGSDGNTFSSIEIYDITSDYQPRGIWCDSCGGNQFTDINIHDVDNTDGDPRENSCAYGIHLSSSSGNTFDEITISSITGGNWSEGIQLSYSHNNTVGDLSISDVYGNKYVYGILLLDSSDNTFGSSSEIWNIDAEFGCSIGIGIEKDIDGSNRNTFKSFDIHDTCYGFYIDKSGDNFITKSKIHDNVEGVHLCSAIDECVGNRLKCNNIYRNRDYGVYKENPPDVDATGNWWGDASGPAHSPGTGDRISDNVLYDPWLLDEFQYCPECGGTPRPPVGGEAYPVSRLAILAPWIALIAAIITGTTIIRRRRRA